MSAVHRVMEVPWLYRAWQAPFADRKFAPVRARPELARAQRVLDVGCGPGTNTSFFSHADYLGVDLNPRYTATAARRYGRRFLACDVVTFAARSTERFDFILSNSLLHHLADDQVARLLGSLHRLLAPEGTIHILDLVLPPNPSPSRLLARLDRGRYARPLDRWKDLFASAFVPLACEPYDLGVPGVPLWRMVYLVGAPRA